MDTLTPIFDQIKKKEKRYSEKTLVGLIDVSADEYNSLEIKAKEIMAGYKYHPHIFQAQSDILSVYAILFDVHKYTGDRFWESIAMRFGFDEKYVRDVIIEAMKITYESRCWSFYQTTRNEYVETIRMHGVIGNDSSGDKIIYALYVMYLKDFEKEVTNEKLDFFFPYLRKIFKNHENSADDIAANYDLNGVAYIRGQLPKSFMHAFLVNPSAVATELTRIFKYFESMESGKDEPVVITERFKNKIKDSLERNHGFENEYTRAYISKKPKKLPQKDKIEYLQRAVRLHVPTHFIDFQANEDQNVVLKVFNFKHMLKTVPLNISAGGIGWKSDPVDLTFAKQHKNIRYTIEKLNTKEVIYDSQKELYEENVNRNATAQTEQASGDKGEALVPTKKRVFTLQPTGEKVETSLDELKPGYIYEISPPDAFSVERADTKRTKESLFVLAMNRTVINDGKTNHYIRPHKILAAFSDEQYIGGMKASVDDVSYHILTGAIRFGIVMGFPYSLNELQLKVNEETYDGLAIRKKLLKEVKLMDNGDFLYVMEISEGLRKQDTNILQAFINIKDLQLKYVQQRFYYDPNWTFSCQQVQFNHKRYIQIDNVSELDKSKPITSIDNDRISAFLDREANPLQVVLNVRKTKEDEKILSIQELEKAYLYDPESKCTVTERDKEIILAKLENDWSGIINQFAGVLLKDTSADTFISHLMKDYLSFSDTFAGCLPEVDDNFTDHILSGLRDALYGELTMKGNRKKYVAELIRMLATYQMDRVSFNHVLKAMRLYKVSVVDEKIYRDLNHSLHFNVPDVTGSDSFVEKLLDDISPERQQLSRSLYRLATNPTLSEFDTITEVKDIQAKHPDKDAMSYYELVIIFKLFISDRQFARSTDYSDLFMDMFYQFAVEYNKETVCDFMNELETQIENSKNEQQNQVIRDRLVQLAQHLNIKILIKNECNL